MQIYFWPAENRENEYIDNILLGLKRAGIENINGKQKSLFGKLFDLFSALVNPSVKIFHFNWIENFSVEYTIKAKLKIVVIEFILLFGKLLGKKFVWTMHNKIPHKCKSAADIDKAKRYMRKWIRSMDMIIVHSTETQEILWEQYNYPTEQILFVPIGKYENIEISEDRKEKFRQKLGICKSDILYECFGIIDEYKNIPVLIKAFKDLKLSNAKLLICGKYSKELSEKSRKYITEAGMDANICLVDRFIDNEELPLFINIADVIVLPYKKVSMQNSAVAILAMSYYKPMIVSEFGFIKDIKEYPFVLSYDYVKEECHYEILKSELRKFYYTWVENINRDSIAEQEKRYVEEKLNWDNICSKVAKRYTQLITSKENV